MQLLGLNNMDRGQTCDIVDTPPKDRCNRSAAEDRQTREKVVKWRDIQQGTHKVHEVQDRGHSKYRPLFVLKL